MSFLIIFRRKHQLEKRQEPLRNRMKELEMELAQQIQLLTVKDVSLHARPTALDQKERAGNSLRGKWVGGSLAVKSSNAKQKVTSSHNAIPIAFCRPCCMTSR